MLFRSAKTRKDLGAALTAAAGALAASPDEASAARGRAVRDLLGFYGRDTSALGAADFAVQLDAAMQFVRTGLGPTARYFQPGEGPVEESWLPGFRVYVLGPPRDEAALNDLGEHGSSDLYGLSSGLGVGARQRASGGPADEEAQADMPFDARFRHPLNDASTRRSASRGYWNQAEAWRRVDDDWLHVATDMALQLDSATNNSSLALAFERISDGKVLLFPGDAQQGNWLSWHAPSMRWTVPVSPGGRGTHTVTAADLLTRTVRYKVGHHASHNATAKAKGLELMTSPDLTAFIPVDRAVALTRNPKGSWKMPARDLYRRLLERCQGRVVRSDVGWADTSTRATRREVEQEDRKSTRLNSSHT